MDPKKARKNVRKIKVLTPTVFELGQRVGEKAEKQPRVERDRGG